MLQMTILGPKKAEHLGHPMRERIRGDSSLSKSLIRPLTTAHLLLGGPNPGLAMGIHGAQFPLASFTSPYLTQPRSDSHHLS